jgi:chromosomal replication initiator protein
MANSYTNNEVWQVCLNRIKEQTSQVEFAKWYEPIHPISFDGTNLRLMVPNESYVTHIQENYMKIFAQAIMQMYGRQTRLLYSVPSSEERTSANADMTAISRHVTQTDTSHIMNPFAIPGMKRLRIDPQLNAKYTFSTHVEGECNRLARSAGMTVALEPGSSPFNPLYIYGGSGLGKTHIAQAIGHEVRERHP